jgi:putative dimethyl sulfoxide reductase chaperone
MQSPKSNPEVVVIDPSNPEAANAAFTKLAFIALARANLFRLLAEAFYNPTVEFVQRLQSGAYVSELNGYFKDLASNHPGTEDALLPLKKSQQELSGRDPDEFLKELKVEYARLFIGPGNPVVQPYETFYDQRMTKESQPLLMVSPAAIAVEKIYREAGVAMAKKLQEPPDHIAVELEFLYYLSKKESDAWAEPDNAAANDWHRQGLAFIETHLGGWGQRFCSQVQAESTQSFYRSITYFAGILIKLAGSNNAAITK